METAAKDEGRVIEMPKESFTRNDERGLPAVRSQGNAGSLLIAIERVASNPDMDIEKIERLFAMHQQLMAKEAESAFNDAMARAQSRIVPIVANQKNEHTRSVYADLAAISRVIVPFYTAEGLSISFDSDRPVLGADGKPISPPPQGWFRTIAIVSHSGGHSRQHHIDLPSDEVGVKGNANKTPIQGVVSMTTYGRRVLTCMVFNVPITDEDGNRDEERRNEGKKEERKAEGLPAYAAEDFTKNLPAWTKLIKSGKKTASQIITMVSSKAVLSDEQKKQIETASLTFAEIAEKLEAADKAKDKKALVAAATLIEKISDDKQRADLEKMYEDFGGEWE